MLMSYQVDLHVHVNFLISDLLLCFHDDPDVVQIVDRTIQLAIKVHHLITTRIKS